MDENIIELKNKINSDNNSILYEIIRDLQAVMNYIKEENILTKLRDVINKMNIFIKENNKNLELIKKDISILNNKLNEQYDGLLINNINNNKELKFRNGKYNGQAVNGLAEGKGIWLGKNGDKYEGEWKLGLAEGKGIKYFKNGDKYEGDFKKYFILKMVIDTKENLRMIKGKVKVFIIIIMEIDMKVII